MTTATTEALPTPARPAELTLAFLQRVIADAGVAAPLQRVVAFSWNALEAGVISEVVGVRVELENERGDGESSSGTVVPVARELIAKFLRPEFPFETMFQVESAFYKKFAATAAQHAASPFGLPRALFLSNQLIIMERVAGVDTFSCVHGCPASQIGRAVTTLARMHGHFWTADCSSLAKSAGIGSELSGETKRDKFPGCWRAYLDDVPIAENERARVARLCEKLSDDPSRLARVHDAVANGPSTLIHGDFHTGNLLFPPQAQDDDGEADKAARLWLVDWATCGRGNPMRDLAFFFIVGVRSEDRAASEARSLDTYVATMRDEGVGHLTRDEWTRHYRACVLNQFVILVVYDHLSKHLALNAKSEKLRQELHAHFREVNARACLAVLDHFDEAAIEQL